MAKLTRYPFPATEVEVLAPLGSRTHRGLLAERSARRSPPAREDTAATTSETAPDPAQETREARFLRSYRGAAALIDRLADFDQMLAALEARPAAEGPLEACLALTETPVVQELALGADDVEIVQLLTDHPTLSGHFLWKVQGMVGRMAIEFGRRLGVPHTDLLPQMLAAGVIAVLNAALTTWLSDPEATPADELIRRGLVHLAEGMATPERT